MRWIIVKMVCHCSYSSIECIPKPSLPERLITAGDAQKKMQCLGISNENRLIYLLNVNFPYLVFWFLFFRLIPLLIFRDGSPVLQHKFCARDNHIFFGSKQTHLIETRKTQ